MDVTLVIDKKNKVVVKGPWVERWHFLTDIVSDMGTSSLPWSYTPLTELKAWVKLNQAMDKKSKRGHELLPLSAMWDTVRYMNPVKDDYLFHCYIDGALPNEMRRTSYERLGALIRNEGTKPSYLAKKHKMCVHKNFLLGSDPAYGVLCGSRVIEVRDMKDDVKALVLDLPLNIITGILHQTHFLQKSKSHTPRAEDKYMNEVPWDLIPWHDVSLFADGSWNVLTLSLWEQERISNLVERDWRGIERTANDQVALSIMSRWRRSSPLKSLYTAIFSGIGTPSEGRVDDFTHHIYFQGEVDRGELKFKIANFPLFWDLMIAYMTEHECIMKDFITQEASMTMIYSTQKQVWVVSSREYDASYFVAPLHTFLFCESQYSRSLDSSEYPALCKRMVKTVGTHTLSLYSNTLLTQLEKKPAMLAIEKKRILLFCEAAVSVLEGAAPRGFTAYPTGKTPVAR